MACIQLISIFAYMSRNSIATLRIIFQKSDTTTNKRYINIMTSDQITTFRWKFNICFAFDTFLFDEIARITYDFMKYILGYVQMFVICWRPRSFKVWDNGWIQSKLDTYVNNCVHWSVNLFNWLFWLFRD